MDRSLDEIIRSNPSEFAFPDTKQRDKEHKRNRSKWERIEADDTDDNEEDLDEMPELPPRGQFPKPKVSAFEIESESEYEGKEEPHLNRNWSPFTKPSPASQENYHQAEKVEEELEPTPETPKPEPEPKPRKMTFLKPKRTCETSDEEDSDEEAVTATFVRKRAPRKTFPDNLVFTKPRRVCEDSDDEDEDEADNVGYPALEKEAMMAERKTLTAKIVSSGYGRAGPTRMNSPFVRPAETAGNTFRRQSWAGNNRSNHRFHHRNAAVDDDDDDEPISISMYDNGMDEDKLDRLAGKRNLSGAGMKRKYDDIWSEMKFDDGAEDVQMEEEVQDFEVKISSPIPTYGKRQRMEHITPPAPKRDLDPVEVVECMSLDEIIRRRDIRFTEQPGVYGMEKETKKRSLGTQPQPQALTLDEIASFAQKHTGRGNEHGCSVSVVQEHLSKYWAMRYRLFTKFDQGIKLDFESWYSVTPEEVAEKTAKRMCVPNGVIVDGFCGCGGNTIQFALTSVKKVIAIDIDEQKLEFARHNARIYGVEHKIEFIHGDFLKVAETLDDFVNAVFLSPPWGGTDYKRQDFDLRKMPVDGYELFEVAKRISNNIAFFVPKGTIASQLDNLSDDFFPPEIEQNSTQSGHVIAITAYYGDLRKTVPQRYD